MILNFDFRPNIIHTWMYHADLLGSFINCFGLRKEIFILECEKWYFKKGSSSFLLEE